MQLRLILFTFAALLCNKAAAQVIEPALVVSTGFGVQGLGPVQPFGYVSLSQHIATLTYTTQIYEAVRLKGGLVGTSARAGVTKILWTLGPLWIGLVGDIGVADGTNGGASGAFSGRGFANFHFGQYPLGIIATAQTMKIAGTGEQSKFTLGISYWFGGK